MNLPGGRLRLSSDMPDIATTEKLAAGPEQVRYGQAASAITATSLANASLAKHIRAIGTIA